MAPDMDKSRWHRSPDLCGKSTSGATGIVLPVSFQPDHDETRADKPPVAPDEVITRSRRGLGLPLALASCVALGFEPWLFLTKSSSKPSATNIAMPYLPAPQVPRHNHDRSETQLPESQRIARTSDYWSFTTIPQAQRS